MDGCSLKALLHNISPPQHSLSGSEYHTHSISKGALPPQMSDSPPIFELRAAMDPYFNGVIVEGFLCGTRIDLYVC